MMLEERQQQQRQVQMLMQTQVQMLMQTQVQRWAASADDAVADSLGEVKANGSQDRFHDLARDQFLSAMEAAADEQAKPWALK